MSSVSLYIPLVNFSNRTLTPGDPWTLHLGTNVSYRTLYSIYNVPMINEMFLNDTPEMKNF